MECPYCGGALEEHFVPAGSITLQFQGRTLEPSGCYVRVLVCVKCGRVLL